MNWHCVLETEGGYVSCVVFRSLLKKANPDTLCAIIWHKIKEISESIKSKKYLKGKTLREFEKRYID